MKNFFLFFITVMTVSSCLGTFLDISGEYVDVDGQSLSHDMIVLGEKLQDPYSVENMTRAYLSIYPTKADRVPIECTHLYVRFLPDGQSEYDRLESDGLVLIDHPVDYAIIKEGDYYHDPSIEEDAITWQYSVVPVDYDFPENIECEILEHCYIADDQPQHKSSDGIDWAAVERESYRLSGNAHMLAPQTKSEENNKPSGRITIEDDSKGGAIEGLKGVKVSCNTFVKFAHCYTDEDGYYQFDRSFDTEPRYRIVYKNRHGFGIGFNLLLSPASSSTLGKNPPAGVDVHITSSSERKLYTRSVVNNAAYDYYELCRSEGNMSMKTPPANLRIWLFQGLRKSSAVMMQQGTVVDESRLADYLGDYMFLIKMFLPDITLGLKSLDSYEDIYTATVHELAHATHFMTAGKSYWDKYVGYIAKSYLSSGFVMYGTGTEEDHGYCEVGEMWAYYVQSVLHNERYPERPLLFGTGYWFSPQIFFYMDERGLDRYKIAAALTSDIYERDRLQKKLVSLYPQFKTTINQAFIRYN